MDLTLICAAVIGFGVLMYVVLDGFDLGVGILFPWMPDRAAQDLAVHSIEPVWDGNETWLILGATSAMARAFVRCCSRRSPAPTRSPSAPSTCR